MPHHEYPDEVEDTAVTIAMLRRTIRRQRIGVVIYILLLSLWIIVIYRHG